MIRISFKKKKTVLREKYIYNEKNGFWDEMQGDYDLPCLKLPEEGKVHIGIWGQRHRRYLKNHHRVRYINLLTSDKLNSYFADLNEQAEEMFSRLVKQLAEKKSNGSTQSGKSNVVGEEYEQYPQYCYGDYFK